MQSKGFSMRRANVATHSYMSERAASSISRGFCSVATPASYARAATARATPALQHKLGEHSWFWQGSHSVVRSLLYVRRANAIESQHSNAHTSPAW